MTEYEVIVVGAGAAGMMAALHAAEQGATVALIEPNAKVGRKLYITGKGRCNITNNCQPQEAMQSIPCNGKFLYSALNRFPPSETMNYFTGLGVPLKTERGNRVFPCSDRAADVIDALLMAIRRNRVTLLSQEKVTGVIEFDRKIHGVTTNVGQYKCKALILATGGLSYPLTGSTGDGYEFAAGMGHTIVDCKASLVPLLDGGKDCAKMQGLALKNVSIQVRNSKKKVVYQELGELLFTHFGLSGPLILSASAHLRHFDREQYTLSIDLKPGLDEKKLDQRLLRDFEANANRVFGNALDGLLPRIMVPVFIARTGIDPKTKVHSITKEQRRSVLELLKDFQIPVVGTRPVEEAVVTSGGIKIGEVNPKTMESKLISGLYFAGEILDVDGYTGGFNLQIAWSTGVVAGESAAQAITREPPKEVTEWTI